MEDRLIGRPGIQEVDLHSSLTFIPYVVTGLMGSTKAFSVSGTVPNTFGNFATVANPNAGDGEWMVRSGSRAFPCPRGVCAADGRADRYVALVGGSV